MRSALYVGRVRHQRFTPAPHVFEYPLVMVYLDLGELDRVFAGRWLWSTRRFAPAWFRRADHPGDPERPLDEFVREWIASRGAQRPEGPIGLLTNLRMWGYQFSPLSLYFCHEDEQAFASRIVAEVSNTPWRERHLYLLDETNRLKPEIRSGKDPAVRRFVLAKEFHVSPFLPMDTEYRWSVTAPGRALTVRIESRRGQQTVFDATLRMRRREINGRTLAAALLRHPFMTAEIIGGIYWQALRLWLKGAPFHGHPRNTQSRQEASSA
jgi:DUF1365 family protein